MLDNLQIWTLNMRHLLTGQDEQERITGKWGVEIMNAALVVMSAMASDNELVASRAKHMLLMVHSLGLKYWQSVK